VLPSSIVVTAGNFSTPNGNTSLGSSQNFSSSMNFRLRYTGTSTKRFLAHAVYTIRSGSSNRTVRVRFATDGTALAGNTEQQIRLRNSSRELQGSNMSIFRLRSNEYVEIEITTESSSAALTMEFLNMVLVEL
jgi:hypothetical protein